MVEWAVAAVVFLVAMLAIIVALPRFKPRKGSSGFGIALMMIFASVFDPARAAAVEQLDRKKDIGDADHSESGDKPEFD